MSISLLLSTLLACSLVSGQPTATPNQYIHPTADSGKCLTAASNVNGASVEIEDCVSAGSTAQSWTVSGQAIQIFGDKCLDVTNGATADGTKLQIWTCNTPNTNQEWTLSGKTIQWSGHSSCLDLTDGSTADGNLVQIWSCTGGPNQQWTRTTGPGTAPPPPPPTGTPNQYIHPSADSEKCLTAASNVDGASVEIEDCVSAGSASQNWTVSGQAIQIFGNKCLDVTNGATADGTKLQIWTCTTPDTNQEWTLSGKTIQWSGHSSCLDLTDGSTADGNVVQIWGCTGGPNQQWTRTTGPGTGSGAAGHTIRPGASNSTCLSAPTNANGASVVVEPCDGSASQSWTQNGATILVYGNKCLDVTNGSTANGVKMQIWACTPGQGDAAQHYTITSNKRIQWTGKNECLDLTDGSLANGNQVQMWACVAGNTNQVWNII